MAHLFAHMDAEMRADLADTDWWLDTSDLAVEQTVDAILITGIAASDTTAR